MADNPYLTQSISNFNQNPPPDDGSTVAANQLTWDKHLTKLANPNKNFTTAVNDAAVVAGALTVVNGAEQTNTLAGSIGFTESTLTTATGAIVVTRTSHAVGSEGAAGTDNLDVISATGVATGTLVNLLASATGEVITVRSSATGNIELINGDDVTLDVNNPLGIYFDGTNWRERFRPMDKISAASATVKGIVELATDAETVTGTDTARAITPANAKAKMSAPGPIGDTTASTIVGTIVTATGNISGGKIIATAATATGDAAAMGFGSVNGLELTGEGSSFAVSILNNAGALVMVVPIASTVATFPQTISIDGTTESTSTITGSGHFDGGVGIVKRLNVGGDADFAANLDVGGAFTSLGIDDNADALAMTIDSSETVLIGKTAAAIGTAGMEFLANGRGFFTADGDEGLNVNRLTSDGQLIRFFKDSVVVGDIRVDAGVVSLTGFAGAHISSGIDADLPIGTVASTIDKLHSQSHPKIKVSGTVEDIRVYGVLQGYDEDGNARIAAVGISPCLVTGPCAGGDLLTSNGDGTAKVQADDIIRSSTIGKVTKGNSGKGVKKVACVLYCG